MGQKIHPKGMRIGIVRDWDSRWFSKKEFADLLHEDIRIRSFIKKNLYRAGISRVEIERAANRLTVNIHAGKPGMVIGRGGSGVEQLRISIEKLTGRQVSLNIIEVRIIDLDAQLVAENVALALERRIAFRRAMKQALSRVMRAGAKGCKIMVSGRLGGSELSRTEWTADGSVPLHTFRADVDYGFAEAFTTYGQIGVKVWIYKGEILPERKAQPEDIGAGKAEVVETTQAGPADVATKADPADVATQADPSGREKGEAVKDASA